jgi:hypothetical protein
MGYFIFTGIAFILIALLYWFLNEECCIDMDMFPVVLAVIGVILLFGCGMFSLGKKFAQPKEQTVRVERVEEQPKEQKPKMTDGEYFR